MTQTYTMVKNCLKSLIFQLRIFRPLIYIFHSFLHQIKNNAHQNQCNSFLKSGNFDLNISFLISNKIEENIKGSKNYSTRKMKLFSVIRMNQYLLVSLQQYLYFSDYDQNNNYKQYNYGYSQEYPAFVFGPQVDFWRLKSIFHCTQLALTFKNKSTFNFFYDFHLLSFFFSAWMTAIVTPSKQRRKERALELY